MFKNIGKIVLLISFIITMAISEELILEPTNQKYMQGYNLSNSENLVIGTMFLNKYDNKLGFQFFFDTNIHGENLEFSCKVTNGKNFEKKGRIYSNNKKIFNNNDKFVIHNKIRNFGGEDRRNINGDLDVCIKDTYNVKIKDMPFNVSLSKQDYATAYKLKSINGQIVGYAFICQVKNNVINVYIYSLLSTREQFIITASDQNGKQYKDKNYIAENRGGNYNIIENIPVFSKNIYMHKFTLNTYSATLKLQQSTFKISVKDLKLK